jgi:hypothetical protein
MFLTGMGTLLFSAESCTWRALLFGGDPLAARIPPGRFSTRWSRHGAACDSWGSERTGQEFSLWQSVQFCCCRVPVSSPGPGRAAKPGPIKAERQPTKRKNPPV